MSTKPHLRPVDSESKAPPNGVGTGSSASTSRTPRPPVGLKAAGRRLWRAVLDDWEIDTWEESLLLQACRCADRLDELATIASKSTAVVTTAKGDAVAHAAVRESRAQSIVLARLLASMRLPAGDEEDSSIPVRRSTSRLVRPQRRGGARGAYAARRAR